MLKDKSKLSKKLKAIEVVVNELQNLEEEDRQDVITFALKQVGLTNPLDSTTPTGGSAASDMPTGQGVGDNIGIDRFVSNKKPADQYQRIAVLAYFLKHKDKKNEFKNSEMAKTNTIDARQPRIGNITD